MVRIRAPIKLLEQQADIEDYKLEFKPEIDPGSEEFWNKEVNRLMPVEDHNGNKLSKKQVVRVAIEVEEEKKELSRKEAELILDNLVKSNKIGPAELGMNPTDEKEVMLNRRVHALERIVDKVPVWNRYPAYTAFETDLHLRYLFNEYPGVRGKSLFRVKDRLYLTKCILDRNYNFGQLLEKNIIEVMTTLHDANRGENCTSDNLLARWLYFWWVPANEVGSPLVTDPEYHRDEMLKWWQIWKRPFCQPLLDIREYFGEKIALYHAWFGHYTYMLLLPCLASFVVFIIIDLFYPEHDLGDGAVGPDYFQIGMILFITTWVVYYNKTWEEQSLAISYKWGTNGFESVQKDRPQFKGEPLPDGRKLRSFVDNKEMLYYPSNKRVATKIFSSVVMHTSNIYMCIPCPK